MRRPRRCPPERFPPPCDIGICIFIGIESISTSNAAAFAAFHESYIVHKLPEAMLSKIEPAMIYRLGTRHL
jgi:hypothetical protein